MKSNNTADSSIGRSGLAQNKLLQANSALACIRLEPAFIKHFMTLGFSATFSFFEK